MIEKLEKLCIDSIGLNLFINYQIFKKYFKDGLPKNFMEKIYKNSFEIVSKFKNEDLFLFQNEHFELKDVDLTKKQFNSINNYDFLNKQQLDKFIIGNYQRIQFKSTNFSFKAKNLEININSVENFTNLEILLKNCEIVESLIINSTLSSNSTNDDWLLHVNISENLRSVDFLNTPLTFRNFKLFMEKITDKSSLNEISINMDCLDWSMNKDMNSKEIDEYLYLIPNGISKFSLLTKWSKVLSCLPKFIENHKNITKFHLNSQVENESLLLEVLDSVEIHLIEKMEILNLRISKLSQKMHDLIIKFLVKASLLQEFYANFENTLDMWFGIELLVSFSVSNCNLKKFTVSYYDAQEMHECFDYVLPVLSSLTNNDLGHAVYLELDSEEFQKYIEIIKEKSEVLVISFWNISMQFFNTVLLNNFHQLRELMIYEVDFTEDFIQIFSDGFQPEVVCKSLKKLEISHSAIDENGAKAIENFFLRCNHLESVKFVSHPIFEHLINGLKYSLTTLESFEMDFCMLGEKEVKEVCDFLKECRRIRNFKVIDNILSIEVFYEFLLNLSNSRRCLESFGTINTAVMGISDVHISIYNLAEDSFHNLNVIS